MSIPRDGFIAAASPHHQLTSPPPAAAAGVGSGSGGGLSGLAAAAAAADKVAIPPTIGATAAGTGRQTQRSPSKRSLPQIPTPSPHTMAAAMMAAAAAAAQASPNAPTPAAAAGLADAVNDPPGHQPLVAGAKEAAPIRKDILPPTIPKGGSSKTSAADKAALSRLEANTRSLREAGVGPMAPLEAPEGGDDENSRGSSSSAGGVNDDDRNEVGSGSGGGEGGTDTETAPEGEDDSITRCICDFLHDDGYMICCDKCS